MTLDQLTLEDAARRHNVAVAGLRVGRHLSIAERYAEWRATPDGETVFREVRERALRLRAAGWRHYSHKALIESVRYDRHVQVGPDSGFKVNDHYAAHLGREVMASDTRLSGFFEVRGLRA